jgi:drug/metabolite transporter (DMT)-like permease
MKPVTRKILSWATIPGLVIAAFGVFLVFFHAANLQTVHGVMLFIFGLVLATLGSILTPPHDTHDRHAH